MLRYKGRFGIAAELTTTSNDDVVTSEEESTSVTMAANDAVMSSSVYEGVSTEGSSQQMTQEASSSLTQMFSTCKLHLDSNL